MKSPIFIANWKMRLGVQDAAKLAKDVATGLAAFGGQLIICPSFPALQAVRDVLKNHPRVSLGAQNIHSDDSGAYTGEVSGPMLKEVGCTHVIIGHSERRLFFNETNDFIRAKMKAALRNSLLPILCVGETISQRNNGSGQVIIREQLMTALEGIELPSLFIAYEPVWAIGTGHAAGPDEVAETREFISEVIKECAPKSEVRLIYGGSVSVANIASFVRISGMSGALVGSASTKLPEVLAMCHELNSA